MRIMIKIAALLVPILLTIGLTSTWIEADQLRHGTIPAQTIQIDRLWTEKCGFTTCYYAAVGGDAIPIYPAPFDMDMTERDLFLTAQPGLNCAVIASQAIRQIQPGRCP